MIPASYMFKQVYDQAWNEPENSPAAEPQQDHTRGLLTPIITVMKSLFARQPNIHALGTPAYD